MMNNRAGEWRTRGFINEHAHLDKGYLIPDLAYKDDLVAIRAEYTRSAKQAFTKESIMNRAEKAIQLLIQSGVAYVRTHVDVDPLVGLQGIEALLELQAKYANELVIDITAFNQEGFDRYPQSTELLAEALQMGRMGIGGHTLADADGQAHIRRIFELAEQHNAYWVEFHTDESGKPEHFLLPYLANETLIRGWQGHVYAIHCNTLANVPDIVAEQTIEQVTQASLHVTVCPTAIATRAITRVKQLAAAGVRIGMGSDNMADLFNPMGSGNMLQYAQMLAYIQRFYEPGQMAFLLQSILQDPIIEGARECLERRNISFTYSTSDARELLTHAPLPQINNHIVQPALNNIDN